MSMPVKIVFGYSERNAFAGSCQAAMSAGYHSGDRADRQRDRADHQDIVASHVARDLAHAVDTRVQDLHAGNDLDELLDRHPFRQEPQAAAQSQERPQGADDGPLLNKDADDLAHARAERSDDSDFFALVNGHRRQGHDDAEGRHDHDEEKKDVHHSALAFDGVKVFVVPFSPCIRGPGRRHRAIHRIAKFPDFERIRRGDAEVIDGIALDHHLRSDVKRDKDRRALARGKMPVTVNSEG